MILEEEEEKQLNAYGKMMFINLKIFFLISDCHLFSKKFYFSDKQGKNISSFK